jgi:CRISPR-associated protein (TIGR03986 family)
MPDQFHNPYNFVPLAPPKRAPEQTPPGEMGLMYGPPAGLDRYHDDLWSGRIDIAIETVTPLLIPDAATVETAPNGHKTFDVRLGPDGRPLLPITTLKGALRSAYEAVTNSRLAVFSKVHAVPPARRMDPREAPGLVPVIISTNGNDLIAKPLTGTNPGLARPDRNHPVYAAWLPMARQTEIPRALRNSLKHGSKVTVRIQLIDRPPFKFWEVVSVAIGHGANAELNKSAVAIPRRRYTPRNEFQEVDGYFYRSGWNIENKHDERVFFVQGKGHPALDVPLTISKRWTNLIENYRSQQGASARRPVADWPDRRNSPQPVNSWHVWATGAEKLKDGDICYARLDTSGTTIVELSPVSIGRQLGYNSPENLISADLKPAQRLDHLSPADRVFGWVNQGGKGAYKGQFRIHSIECQDDNAVERHESPVPLAILSSPKHAQARFYLARDDKGAPLIPSDDERSEGYFKPVGKKTDWRLRGRKVYPHHRMHDSGEYRRAGDLRDDQNRSIKAWVKSGTHFTARIEITNLTAEEVGALLWLFSLGDGIHHRVGGAKPLGFGSVRITLKKVDLAAGQSKRETYRSLLSPIPVRANQTGHLIGRFHDAVKTLYGSDTSGFEEVSFIKAWLNAGRGFADLPIHYPRARRERDIAGENFKWFVRNKATKLALGDLVKGDPPLPYQST